ncbi:MAG: hypothetical protein Q7S35_03975 [Candidatus Limnocylindrales bacterium]|nr:hypothetical protein [Candidatus Limnocylindrales bacterium]
MIERVGRRLRLVLGRPAARPPLHDEGATAAPSLPEVEFIGYAEDCLLIGHIRLNADRLSDLLNAHEEYQLVDVLGEDLSTGATIEIQEILVTRDELLLVHATGPRGDPGRRQPTRQHLIALQIGPYHVRGYLHALPGSDPMASFRRRKPMVPLTEAWVEYASGSVRQRRRVASLIVNRHRVDWITEADDEPVELPDFALHAEKGPLRRDLIGRVLALEDSQPG